MEYFCYQRDRPGAFDLRMKMLNEHWSYLEEHSPHLLARGPTFAEGQPSGSVYFYEAGSPPEARAFLFDEPAYQAGVYQDVILRRWRNQLDRTVAEFPMKEGRDIDKYLVIGFGEGPSRSEELSNPDQCVAFGPLLSDDGRSWLGAAGLVQAEDSTIARSVLTEQWYAHIEVHPWQPGGRR